MSRFHCFSALPTELRLEIWRQALAQPRTLVLDAHVQVAIATGPAPPHQPPAEQRIVIGGTFWGPWPQGRKDVVRPASAASALAALSLACVEARGVVLERFPDVVHVQGPEGEFTEPEDHVPMAPRALRPEHRWLRLRCSLQRDLLLVRQLTSAAAYFGDYPAFAQRVHGTVGSAAAQAEHFRRVLGRVRNLAIERPSPAWVVSCVRHQGHYVAPKNAQYRNLLAGATGLENLYLFPADFARPEREQNHESQWTWRRVDRSKMSQGAAASVSSVDDIYQQIRHRFVSPACVEESVARICDIAQSVQDEASESEDMTSQQELLQKRLEKIGFKGQIPGEDCTETDTRPREIFVHVVDGKRRRGFSERAGNQKRMPAWTCNDWDRRAESE